MFPLTVVAGRGQSLFGQDWLRYLLLDLRTIGLATLDEYPEIFAEQMGTMCHFKASLQIKSNAMPIFCKHLPVPFVLKESIEKELDHLEGDGILKKANNSEWAAPIVPVPKIDGRMHLCGDYKATVNQIFEVHQYPLPKSENLFAFLVGGQDFLSWVCTFLRLTSKCNWTSIRNHMSPSTPIRASTAILGYSAQANFQHTMDTILHGIPHVQCYIDDI